MKKKIVIIGAGTAGASAFAYLSHYFKDIATIELVASEEIETVGVGEATVGNINAFLESMDLCPEEICLDDSRGSIKYSVHLKDWYKENISYSIDDISIFIIFSIIFDTNGRSEIGR